MTELERRYRAEQRGGKRPDEDPMVIAAIAEAHRPSTDIWIVECPWCGWYSYWNEGSHASCRNCGRDTTAQTAEAITLADYWDDAPYPGDVDG